MCTSSFSLLPTTTVQFRCFNVFAAPGIQNETFQKYAEMDNPTVSRIEAIKKAIGGPNDEWVGTEKVHGANFGIFLTENGDKIQYAKRSGILPEREHFFAYHLLIPEMKKWAQIALELVQEKCGKDVEGIVMNGELFGGKYSHPQVPRSTKKYTLNGQEKRVSPIQNDAFPQYSPDIHFFAFDLKYRRASATESWLQLPIDEILKIFSQIDGLLYGKAVIRGTLDHVLAFDLEKFETQIPALLGLGAFPLEGNISEGLVIRHAKKGIPEFDKMYSTISTMFKFKSVTFQEYKHPENKKLGEEMARIRQASISLVGNQIAIPDSLLPKVESLASESLLNHVCDTRLKNVISKSGYDCYKKGEKTKEALALDLAKDSLKDFLRDTDEAVVNTNIAFRKTLILSAMHESLKLVNKHWNSILKEDF